MGRPDRLVRSGVLPLGLALALASGCAAPTASAPQAPPATQPGSAASASQSTALPSLLPTPSADPILSALAATRARGTARVALELLTSAPDAERSLVGEGIVDFARGAADLRWSGQEGDSREVRTEEGFFVEVQDGQWLAVDPGRSTPTSDAGGVLRGLDGLRDTVQEGSESIGGVSAARIIGWLPATGSDEGNTAGLGLTDTELTAVASAGTARIRLAIWVDDSGRIIQVVRTLVDAEPISATSIARLSDFGVAAPITTPSSIAASAR